MKTIFFLLILLTVFTSCDTVETDPANIQLMPATKIEKVEINNNIVKVYVIVGTPDPCWDYYKTESSELNNEYTAKIYAKPNGASACPCVLWSFTREETIYFTTKGEKSIKFWQNDSTYVDTTIVL